MDDFQYLSLNLSLQELVTQNQSPNSHSPRPAAASQESTVYASSGFGRGPPRQLSGQEPACQRGRHSLSPWVGKTPRRAKCSPLQCSWRNTPRTEEPGALPSMGPKSRTRLSDVICSLSLFALPGARSPSLSLAHRSVFSQTVFRYRLSSQASRCRRGCSPHPCSNPMPGSPITLIQP